MQITPFGHVPTQFDLLSRLGGVTPQPRREIGTPIAEPQRRTMGEARSGETREDTTPNDGPTPVLRQATPAPRPAPAAPTGTNVPRGARSPATQGTAPAAVVAEGSATRAAAPRAAPAPEHGFDAAIPVAAAPHAGATPPAATPIAPPTPLVQAASAAKASAPTLQPVGARSAPRNTAEAPRGTERPSYAPRSEKMLELAREQRDSIFRSIALALSEKGGKAHFRLEPAELGSVGVELELEGDQLRVKVRVEREELASAMREDLPKLQQQLEARGFAIRTIDVQTSSRHEQQRDAMSFRREHGAPGVLEAAGTTDASPTGHGGLLAKGLGLRLGHGIDYLA